MAERKPYIGADGEVRQLDEHFFKHARRGRPPLPPGVRKKRVQLMLDPDVVAALRKDGRGMSGRVNDILRKALDVE